jgi:hypothetical protein
MFYDADLSMSFLWLRAGCHIKSLESVLVLIILHSLYTVLVGTHECIHAISVSRICGVSALLNCICIFLSLLNDPATRFQKIAGLILYRSRYAKDQGNQLQVNDYITNELHSDQCIEVLVRYDFLKL